MFFKVFDENWECRGMAFSVGTTTVDNTAAKIYPGINGISFNMSASSALRQYNPDSKVALVRPEPNGAVIWSKNTSLCEALCVIREVTWDEIFALVKAETLLPELTDMFTESTKTIPDMYATELAMQFYGRKDWNGVVRDRNGKVCKVSLNDSGTMYPSTINTKDYKSKGETYVKA